jgi:hypothetical protein
MNTSRTNRHSCSDTSGNNPSKTVAATETRTPPEPRHCRRLTNEERARRTTPSTLCAFVHTKKTRAQLAAVDDRIRRAQRSSWIVVPHTSWSRRIVVVVAVSVALTITRQHTHRKLANSQKSYPVDCAKICSGLVVAPDINTLSHSSI